MQLSRVMPLAFLAVILAGSRLDARRQEVPTPAAGEQTAAVLAAGAAPGVAASDRQLQREIAAVYEQRGWAPLWTADGRVFPTAREALTLLEQSDADGLDPREYRAAEIAGLVRQVDAQFRRQDPGPGRAATGDVARIEVAITGNLLKLMRDLHAGRVPPSAVGYHLPVPDEHDYAAILRDAASAGRLTDAVRALAPTLPQYGRLKSELARYRQLADDPDGNGWTAPAKPVRPGDSLTTVQRLRRFLVITGDLRADAEVGGSIYAAPLIEAVMRFQQRHGLDPDGVIGAATRAALAIPLSARVRQIELSMERLRWLAHPAGRLIIVNIPTFRLTGIDAEQPAPAVALDMAVVVGKAPVTTTPVFEATMTHVIFRPYWNVPRSILRNELLPPIRRNSDYIRKHGYEIVRGESDDAQVVAPTSDAIEELAAGRLRLRQRPGPANALGLIKFVFPNPFDVYMHDTPSTSLFARPRRDFSHGCVRLERPADLAEWVLTGTGEWTRDTIAEAMQSGADSRRVDLAKPLRVMIFYMTARVAPDSRDVSFAADVYGHDARLARAIENAAGSR